VAGSQAYDVVVIGAGVSGLVAAYTLQRRGVRVALVDAGDAPGGVIASRRHEGFLYETAANSTLDTTPLLRSLLEDLGIANERVEPAAVAAKRFIVRQGRLVALPTSPGAFVAGSAFSLRAKLRLMREPFIRPAPADADESVAAFVRRRLGSELLDYAVDPFVAGIYAGDAEAISVRAAFPRLHALEQRHGSLIRGQIAGARERRANPETSKHAAKSFSFRGGMQTLPDALATRLSHYLPRTRVAALTSRDGGGYDVQTTGPQMTARAVVLATPAYATASIVEGAAPAAATALRAIDYAPVAVVVTAYRREDVAHDLAGFGFLVPKKERRRILGSLFSSSLFEGRAPPGHVLFTTFVGGQRDPAAPSRDDAALATAVTGELEALVGACHPLWSRIVRWPQAIPQYTIGHLARVAAVDDACAAFPGWFHCASWRGGVSVGDCVKSAHETAERVHAFLSARTPR
jgi:oxygen-dependent protoporphyrinogen oxidase